MHRPTPLREAHSPSTKTQALLIGGDPRLLGSLRSILEQQADIKVAGQGRNGWDGLRLAGRLKPDLVLSEFEMDDMSGAAVTKALKTAKKPPLVVLVSRQESPVYAQLSSQAGADGYVLKHQLERLLPLIQRLLSRRR